MASLRRHWRGLFAGLWFLPTLIVLLLGGLAFALLQLDERVVGHSTPWVFGGDPSAARTILTTIAGSLITVAGLTFSITMIVLQLASSQFSPRVLPTFLADRLTQITVGAFIGIFVFCLVGLRAVGGVGHFVPRLTVTIASTLGVLAVILLIVFIHHVSTMIQVSHVAARIARQALGALDELYPEPVGEEGDDDAATLLDGWRSAAEPERIEAARPGYVRQVDVVKLLEALGGQSVRLHVPVAPGDFVSLGTPVLEVWPAEAAADARDRLRRAVSVGNERDLAQDASFGVRQLADIALRAISPGINDPTTAVTCIGYIRSILERLASRRFPSEVRRLERGSMTLVARRVEYREYLDTLAEIGRHARGDIRIVRQLIRACAGVSEIALAAGTPERVAETDGVAAGIVEQALAEVRSPRERELIEELAARQSLRIAASRASASA